VETDSINDVTNPSSKAPLVSKFRKTPILIVSGIAIATVLGFVGYRWWSYASTHESTNDAYVTGYLHPVSSRISGTVVYVHVDDNQKVQKGQVLVELDPKDYQVVVQNAQAALENAKRQAGAAQATINLSSQTAQANTTEAKGAVGTAIAGISSAQAMVNQAQAAVVSAQDQFAKAQAQEINAKVTDQRYEQLYQSGAIPKQQRDDASTAYQVAQAQTKTAQQSIVDAKAKYQSALDGIDQAKANLVDSQGKVQQAQASGQQTEVNRRQYQAAQAQIAAATANLKQAQLNLSYTLIKAPTTGRIGNKTVQVGQRVQPEQPLLAVVGGNSWIVANFNETQLSKMQPGEIAEIRVDTFSGKTFKGSVNSLSPASGSDFSLLPPDNATGNFTKVVQRIPVKVTFDPNSIKGYENRITPGMSVEVTVNTGR
jgi:membrane fusion protein (multidrug efflux system)